MIKNISNLGDAAIYCDFGKDVNEKINSNVISYFNHLKKLIRENKIEGITNLTPSYNKLIISFDLSITNFKKITKILENLKVINEQNEFLGIIDHVMPTGANDVLVVKPLEGSVDNDERLIPFLKKEIITKVELLKKTVYVKWPKDF